jgi:hypothetical protein
VYNETDYYCENYTEWDGPSNFSYSIPYSCYSYNTTLTSYVYSFSPTFTSSTGANNTQSYTSLGATAGAIWFDGPFSATDHYVLELDVYGDAYADNSWAHGYASWNYNVASAGNEIKLVSITES